MTSEEKEPKETEKTEENIGIESLKKDLQKIKEEYEEMKSLAQRIKADFDNYRKRVDRENEIIRKYACEDLILRILEVVDTLDRAISHEKGEFKRGLEMIKAQIESILSDFGVKPIESVGMEFDPELHEAVSTEKGDKDNIVVEEYQKGYILHDKVIRHSKVKVSKR